jgi:hypothetical protein
MMIEERKANVDQSGVKQKVIILVVCVFALKIIMRSRLKY